MRRDLHGVQISKYQTVAQKNYILDQSVAEKKMRRMALEIIENNADEKELILAGVRESGSIVARCIQKMLAEISPVKTSLLTITLDKRQPGEVVLSQSADFNDKVIILIDDVANSGKTLLYALKPFLAYHPKKIQTLVLVERSHNSFPVHPDYAGISIATTLQEHIYVQVDEEKVLGAYLE
jgi:pyrimidine operon attenuation protein / uracil phosphoribosyltransferase